MTDLVAGIRRRRMVAGRRETPHLPPDRDFYGQTLIIMKPASEKRMRAWSRTRFWNFQLANSGRLRNLARIGLAVGAIAVLAGVFFGREDIPLVRDVVQQSRFDALGETISTNVVVQQLLWEKLDTNKLGMVFLKERAFRNITNAIDVTLVRLNRGTNVFVRPMQLKPNHEYWVVGPGILDASVTPSGTNTTMRLKNCVFLNRSSVPFRNTGIRYVFQGGAYLNFTNMDRPEDFSTRQFEGFDGAFDEIRFKGESSERFRGSDFANISEEQEAGTKVGLPCAI